MNINTLIPGNLYFIKQKMYLRHYNFLDWFLIDKDNVLVYLNMEDGDFLYKWALFLYKTNIVRFLMYYESDYSSFIIGYK